MNINPFEESVQTEKIKDSGQLKEFYEDFHSRICLKESGKFNRWLLRILRPLSQERLLDIACGGGYLVSEANKCNLSAFGVDISEKVLQVAAGHTNKERLFVADAEHLPCQSASFDIITCLGSLEHFLHPEMALKELLRVAKDDACLCIFVPNLFSWDNIEWVRKTGKPPTHGQELERFATREQWQNLLEANGVEVKKTVKYNGFPKLFEIKNGKIKIKSLRKFFRRFFIPFNLCSSFIFICAKKKR